MKKFNTAYVECFDEIWDYYFKRDDLLYAPSVLIGEERRRLTIDTKFTKFYNRVDVNNLDIEFKYDLSLEDKKE